MSLLATLLLGPAISAAIAVTILVVGRSIGRPAVALALGASYIGGHLIISRPSFPPVEVTDRIPWIAAAATIPGLLSRPGRAWTPARWAGRLALAAATILAILGPILGESSEVRPSPAWLIALGAGILASWAGLAALTERARPADAWPSLAMIGGGASLVLLASGSLVLGQLGLALTVALIATGALSWRRPGPLSARPGVPVIVATLAALLLEGHVYAGVPTSSLALLAAAPASALLGQVAPFRDRPPWQRTLIGLASTALTVGGAVGFALAASPDLAP